MDEIFHVPQAQRYCMDGMMNAEWDDKITTLPGLYVISVPYAMLVRLLGGNYCDVNTLRSINVILLGGVLISIFFVLMSRRNSQSTLPIVLKSLQLSTLPLIYFFAFLYYTDIGSILFLIIGYAFARRSRFNLSALSCAVAILFRQTNIIWTFWMALDTLVTWYESENKDSETKPFALGMFIIFVINRMHIIVVRLAGYIILGVSFVVFVIINGGLVVGDRTNHIAVAHVPQVMYFSAFCVVFMMGELIFDVYRFYKNRGSIVKLIKHYAPLMIILTPIIAVLCIKYSYVHIFILSDNRHYLFYLWRRLFRIHINPGQIPLSILLAYSPIYAVCIIYLCSLLKGSGKSVLSITCFVLCVCLNLIPLPLIEFRYFITPFIMLNLNIYASKNIGEDKIHTTPSLINLSVYGVINLLTLYMFIFKPFVGPDGEEARIMW
ncbi:alpha-1,2-glucosyltransferase [Acrasis kona]|uniref:Dol-P-Glc:Glc(2)Man(9)GlcNAc(2)-PP-Dol alpha-1,2-glucosyltransferase n=1 Tax=Acrasis kona TaxID=1008807 RepID=A0AAW2YKB0_9EUKA